MSPRRLTTILLTLAVGAPAVALAKSKKRSKKSLPVSELAAPRPLVVYDPLRPDSPPGITAPAVPATVFDEIPLLSLEIHPGAVKGDESIDPDQVILREKKVLVDTDAKEPSPARKKGKRRDKARD